MKRSISTFGLFLTSVSAIIGSGWLFSAFYTAQLAGPASLLSWVIGGVMIILIAFTFAEPCAMLPITGSTVRIPQFTHGTIVSFIFAFLIWLSYVTFMSVEVQAVVQYLSFYFPYLVTGVADDLTHIGYLIAVFLLIIISAINVYSTRWLINCNNFLTIIKIFIPIFISAVILIYFFKPESLLHPAHSSFSPLGFSGVLGAISTGGVLFAFNGFKQAAEMAGEVKNPGRSVPMALVGSVLFCLGIYILIQLAFNASMTPSNLVNGWEQLKLGNAHSPFASVLAQDDLRSLLPLLSIGAVIAPFAASLIYCSSAGRSIVGMSRNGYLPRFLQVLSPHGNPIYAILVNFFFGILVFIPLHGWAGMMVFLTSILAITYAIAPVCLLALRYQLPDYPRPIKLPFATVWATVVFYVCTMRIYFAGWEVMSKISIVIAIVFLAIALEHYIALKRKQEITMHWRESIWLWPYVIGVTIISYIGNFGGGIHLFSTRTDVFIIMAFCAIIMILAMRFRLPNKVTQKYVADIRAEMELKA